MKRQLTGKCPDVEEFARRLTEARTQHTPVPLLSSTGALSLLDAHEVQRRAVMNRAQARGSRPCGYKISLTSRDKQAILGTTQPTYGLLLDDDCHAAPATVSLGTMFSPLLEPELVFVFDRDLPPYANSQDIAQVTRVAPGFEVPDSRYEFWFGNPELTLEDFVADNSAAGIVVHGPPMPTPEVDLEGLEVELQHEGRHIATGFATHVLGNPLLAVAWLSRQLALSGEVIEAGTFVAAGTLCEPRPLETGSYSAAFTGLGSINLEVTV